MKSKVDTLGLVDYVLKDIVRQLKGLDTEEKNTPYAKLIELFFKGADLRDKVCRDASKVEMPRVTLVRGLDEDLV